MFLPLKWYVYGNHVLRVSFLQGQECVKLQILPAPRQGLLCKRRRQYGRQPYHSMSPVCLEGKRGDLEIHSPSTVHNGNLINNVTVFSY